MEFNKNTVDGFLRLDDESLREQVKALLMASGADERHASKATADMNRLRRKLSGVTESDIKRLMSMMGPEVIAQLSEQLKNNF